MTAEVLNPPGQSRLWPDPPPGLRPSSWRVLWFGPERLVEVGPWVRDLSVAAVRAAGVARLADEAWLAGSDGTWAWVIHDPISGRVRVRPATGWAAPAARIIDRSSE